MKKIYIILFFLFINLSGKSQINKLVEEKVKYQYDGKNPSENYVPTIELGKEIQINFDCCFDDSVQIFVNDKLMENVFLKTDHSTSFTGHSIKLIFDNKQKNTILKVVLPNKQVFCNIILDKKYRLLNVNRMEHWDKKWWITFRNFEIIYE